MTVTDNSQTLVNALAEIKRLEGEIQRQRERHRATWTQLEQVKGLLRCARTQLDDSGISNVLRGQIDAALLQQAEPVCDTCHGQGEVWTGENQSFGYMSMQPPEPIMGACPECGGEAEPVEPATAQDEREAFEECWAVRNADDEGNIGNKPLRSLVDQQRYRGDAVNGSWVWFQRGAAWQRTRPAQTEQQPVAMQPDCDAVAVCGCRIVQSRKLGNVIVLCASHIAQTAPQPEQSGLVEALECVKLTDEEARHHSVSAVAYWNNAVTACVNAALSAQRGEQ